MAEAKFEDREKRVETLNIRDLNPIERERTVKQWEAVQSRFVDSPKQGAVASVKPRESFLGPPDSSSHWGLVNYSGIPGGFQDSLLCGDRVKP